MQKAILPSAKQGKRTVHQKGLRSQTPMDGVAGILELEKQGTAEDELDL